MFFLLRNVSWMQDKQATHVAEESVNKRTIIPVPVKINSILNNIYARHVILLKFK